MLSTLPDDGQYTKSLSTCHAILIMYIYAHSPRYSLWRSCFGLILQNGTPHTYLLYTPLAIPQSTCPAVHYPAVIFDNQMFQ